MRELERYDTEELEAELEERKREKEKGLKPKPAVIPNWSNTQRYCQEYINDLYEKGYPPKDAKQYIFEAAIEATFGGGDVWAWINAIDY